MTIIKSPFVTVQDTITAVNGTVNPNNNILVISKRGISGSSTLLPDLSPNYSYPKVSLYKPFVLNAFGSGNDCLSYLSELGFKVGYGQSSTLNLPLANTVVQSPTGTFTITYTGVPIGFDILVNNSITGTVTQGSNTGTYVSASIVNNNGVLVVNSSSTLTTSALSITYINRSISDPDPAQTEECAMTLWTLFSELNVVGGQVKNVSATFPTVTLLLMGQHDSSYSPNTTNIDLPKPDYVSVLSGGTIVLSYDALPSTWGLLPDGELGNSVLTQTTSDATGVFYQKGVGNLMGTSTANAVCYIILNNSTGTFNTTDVIEAVLDGSQDTTSMTAGNTYAYWIGYHENTTANSAKTTQFETMINNQNNLNNMDKKGGVITFGFLGNISQPLSTAGSLTQLNNRFMVLPYFPQPISPLELVQTTSSQVCAFVCAVASMNGTPYQPMNDIFSSTIKAPGNNHYWIQKGIQESSETILQVGYTPLYVNKFKQVAIVRLINSQIDIPGTQLPDNEFFAFSTWQIISAYNQDCISQSKTPAYTNIRKTPALRSSLLADIISIAKGYETNGMFSNVSALQPLFSVTDDAVNASLWLVNTPIQVIPELSGIKINVSIYSFLYRLS